MLHENATNDGLPLRFTDGNYVRFPGEHRRPAPRPRAAGTASSVTIPAPGTLPEPLHPAPRRVLILNRF